MSILEPTAPVENTPYMDAKGTMRQNFVNRSPFGIYLMGLRRNYKPQSIEGQPQETYISPRIGVISAHREPSDPESDILTISELSRALGLSISTASSYESGHYHPSADVARRIAHFFGVPEADVIERVATSKAEWGHKRRGVRSISDDPDKEAIAAQYSHLVRSNVSYKDLKWLHNKAVATGKSLSRTIATCIRKCRLDDEGTVIPAYKPDVPAIVEMKKYTKEKINR